MSKKTGKRLWLHGVLGGLCILPAALGTACSDNNSNEDPPKRVTFSTGAFNRGYKDGERDARWSLSDIGASWMWLWMAEKEYQQGYDRGWHDGRQAVKLEGKRKEQETETRDLRPAGEDLEE
jgi:hypothetical protein